MIANETQVGGTHYQAVIQTWDYILSHDLGFLEGNIIKYVTRYRKKMGAGSGESLALSQQTDRSGT